MNDQLTIREEQLSALREAAEKLTSRIGHVFNFDQQKLEDFKSGLRDRGPLNQKSRPTAR